MATQSDVSNSPKPRVMPSGQWPVANHLKPKHLTPRLRSVRSDWFSECALYLVCNHLLKSRALILVRPLRKDGMVRLRAEREREKPDKGGRA
jgi:hypothetical protein